MGDQALPGPQLGLLSSSNFTGTNSGPQTQTYRGGLERALNFGPELNSDRTLYCVTLSKLLPFPVLGFLLRPGF